MWWYGVVVEMMVGVGEGVKRPEVVDVGVVVDKMVFDVVDGVVVVFDLCFVVGFVNGAWYCGTYNAR